MFDLKEKYKTPVMVILVAIAVFLIYYFHAILRIGVLFTHFFYIPIILAALWWKRKGLIIAIFLAGLLILSDVLLKLPIFDDLVRSLMFIVIGLIVALLSEIIAKRTNDLRENEEKYRTLFDSSSDEIMLLDENGFFDCNDATLQKFGFSNKEEFTKVHQSQISPPFQIDGVDSLTAANNKIAEAFRTGTNLFEWVYRRQNGEDFFADVLLTAFNYKGKQVLQATVRDITERKHAEDKLKRQNEFIKLVIDSLPHPFYVINIKDHTIAMANARTHIMGEGATCYAVSHKKTSPCGGEDHTCPLEEVKLTKKPTVVEHLHYDINGNPRNMEVHCYPIFDHEGNMDQAIEYSIDITDKKRAEEMLRESEEKYRTLFDSSSDAIMLLDENGFTYCNNATLQIFGFSKKEDFTKLHPSQVSPPYQPDGVDSSTAVNTKIAEAFRTGTNHFEWVHRRKNGEDFFADVLLKALNIKGKQVLLATVRDITERKRTEELHIENIRLEHESKSKSEFLAAMSHELRTPLNAIIGFSDVLILEIGGTLNETQKGYVKDIFNAGQNLLLIINDILDLSLVEAGKTELVKEKFSVHELLEETMTLIKNKAIKHHINIIRDIDPQLEFMSGNKQKIKQVLFNLLSNAVKFSKEEGGTITIAVKKLDGMVRFSISDTGIGIEEKDLNRLFKEFQQLDSGITRKYGGSGLGLAISKKLVELHGGGITVKSIYGEGSTFAFSIPVQKEGN